MQDTSDESCRKSGAVAFPKFGHPAHAGHEQPSHASRGVKEYGVIPIERQG